MSHAQALHPNPATERLKITVAYDGRPFRGWQSQATGDAVQDHLERAFATMAECKVSVQGAGRTDAGVHARGQIAHVDVPARRLPHRNWQRAINDKLPPEIRIVHIEAASPDFHARFNAKGKIYLYRIWNESYLHPLELGRAWLVPGKLDMEVLQSMAALVEGRHDFAGFAVKRPGQTRDTVRNLKSIRIKQRDTLITLKFEGDGFLYKMVRLITGSIIRCALGRAEPQWINALLEGAGKVKTHFAAPAEGLCLERVLY